MSTLITKSLLATAIALTVAACGPGDSSLAGIGGSGYISSGSITGFGSVFVNGVKFETDRAIFDVDGFSGTQDDLAIGMIVKVDGSINDDGISGIATSISFDEELQGPVSTVGPVDADGIKRIITVLGISVVVDSGSTTFDIDGDVPASKVFDFDNIEFENNIEISGFFDTSGVLQATRVELKDIVFDSNSIVEIEGIISNVSGTSFTLGSLMVDASSATLDDLPNGLENDLVVEVKGTLNDTYDILTASKVEAEDDSTDDTDEFEIEGIITNYNSTNKTFNIGDIMVDASSPTLELEPATLILENDVHVEVEGAIIGGVLIATEVEAEGGETKVYAEVTTVDTVANTFKVRPVPDQPEILITVTSGTQLEGKTIDDSPYTLTHLSDSPVFVEIHGFENDTGITAVEIDAKEEIGEVIVQGLATAVTGDSSGGTMTVIGVEFNFNIGSTTKFEIDSDVEGNPDTPMSITEIDDLINAIKLAPQFVKILDKKFPDGNPVGDADEIEIE